MGAALTPLSESSGTVELEIEARIEMHSRTKLPPNEFTRLILGGSGQRRGARDPRAPVHGPAVQLDRLSQVTPAVGLYIISMTKLI